jgi:hypothetical protein
MYVTKEQSSKGQNQDRGWGYATVGECTEIVPVDWMEGLVGYENHGRHLKVDVRCGAEALSVPPARYYHSTNLRVFLSYWLPLR